MARGNVIVVTSNPRGVFQEGFVADGFTPKPGTIMQKDFSVAVKSGRHTYKPYAPGTDGERPRGAFYVLLEDHLQGKTVEDAYAAGDRCFLYVPLPGEELNLLLANVAGTADDHAPGEPLIVDNSTGLLIASTGTPETEVAVVLEQVTDPTEDTLTWCEWTGH